MQGEYWEQRVTATEPVVFDKTDIGFAIAMIVCGFLYWNLIRFESFGAGVSIFAALLFIAVSVYLKKNGIRQTRESTLYLIVAVLSACSFLLFDNVEIKALNFLFLSLVTVYWIAVTTGRRLEDKISFNIIGDGINQLLLVPFNNFNCGFLGLKKKSGGGKRSRGFVHGLLGIVIFLPVLILVISLLVNADAAFESLVNSIQISLSDELIDYIMQIILGIPVACYLFGLVYGNLRNRHTDHISLTSIEKGKTALGFVPGIGVYSALTLLNVVYLVFFLSQTTYLFSAFGDQLPETMTYAEYARRGFFELCAVAGINLCVIGAAHLLTSRRDQSIKAESNGVERSGPPKPLKAETIALCIFTLMLIATGLSKMALYINYYGLTQLRVYTTWFMSVLLIVFIIVGLRQFKGFNGTRIAAVSFIVCFLILCYANVDGIIAKYNIDRYLDGSLANLDVMALAQLSDGAVPHMYKLYSETEDLEMKRSLKGIILGEPEGEIYEIQREDNFRDFNVQTYKTNQIRERLKGHPSP